MEQVLARADLQLWIPLLQASKQASSSSSEIRNASSGTDACSDDDGYPLRGCELLCEGVHLCDVIVCVDDPHGE